MWDDQKRIEVSFVDNRYFDNDTDYPFGEVPLPWGGMMTDEGNNIWSYDFAGGHTLDDNVTYLVTFKAEWDFEWDYDQVTFELIVGNDCFGDMAYLTGEKLENASYTDTTAYIAEWVNADPDVYATPVRITSRDNVIGEVLPKDETFYSKYCKYLKQYSYIDDKKKYNYIDAEHVEEKSDKQKIDEVAKTLGLTEEERDRALKEVGFTEKDGAWVRSLDS